VQANVPPAKLNAVARVDGVYQVNDKGTPVSASDLEPTPWLYREIGPDLNPFPVPGHSEMVQYQATLAPGRFAFRLANTIYDFSVEGTPADPNLCIDRYEISTPSAQSPTVQYRLCNERVTSPALDLFLRGGAWANKGEFNRAIERFDAALKIDPKYLPALGMRAYVRVLTGNFDGGIVDATAAIEIILASSGQNPWATPEAISSIYGIRGLAYINKGDATRAAADANEAIRFNAKNAAAYELRARIFLKIGDAKRALDDAEQFVRLSPTADAFRLRGEVYKALGRRDEAIADFRRALSTQLPPQARNEILALLQELGVTL
jgi:tetratricopeptide (TPR) repeat protein